MFASLYPTIIYSSRCEIFSVPPFKSKFLQITCLFCNCKALQLPAAMQVLIITSIPIKLQPQRRFYSLKTCAGQWTLRSVDTGALFYVACSHFAILRFVSLTYTQLFFHRSKTNKEAKRQTLLDVDSLQELGDITKTRSVKFSPNTL